MRETTAEIELLGDLDAERGMLVAAVAPDGGLVHISEVAAKASANLLCPACRIGVIAVKGPVRAHHFRHRSRADCLAGAETALHLPAKRALEVRPEMVLPRIRLETDRSSRELRPPRLVRLERVALERREGAVRPDVCCVVEGAPLYVEIRVSHRVDEAKRTRLRARGVSTVEIDLSRLRCDATRRSPRSPRRSAGQRRATGSGAGSPSGSGRGGWPPSARRPRAGRRRSRRGRRRRSARTRRRNRRPSRRSMNAGCAGSPGSASRRCCGRTRPRRRWPRRRLSGAASFLSGSCLTPATRWRRAASSMRRHGQADWTGYPPTRFTAAEVVDALRDAELLAPALAEADMEVAAAARRRDAGFLSGPERVARLLDALQEAGLVVEERGLSVTPRFAPSDALLGRVWREAELGRLAGVVRCAFAMGEVDEAAVEDWLDARAGLEIRGETQGESLLPMLKTLADLVRAFERSGRAASEPAPERVVAAAARLGLAQREERIR